MKRKTIPVLFLTAALALSMAACGTGNTSDTAGSAGSSLEQSSVSAEAEDDSSSSQKTKDRCSIRRPGNQITKPGAEYFAV